MVKKRLAAILMMVALSVSAVFPAVSSYASESDDAEKENITMDLKVQEAVDFLVAEAKLV